MKKYVSTQNALVVALVVVSILLGLTLLSQAAIRSDLKEAKKTVQISKDEHQLIYNEIDTAGQLQSLTDTPAGDRLYIPELKVSLPRSALTLSLKYNYNQGIFDDKSGDLRLTSSYMTDHKMRRMSCSDMVRVNIQDKPDAYSPSQPHVATVELTDGRKLQVYASKHKECEGAWTLVAPTQIADAFKQATSY